jgi:hypothetical protein
MDKHGRIIVNKWIPAFAGMTGKEAGMTKKKHFIRVIRIIRCIRVPNVFCFFGCCFAALCARRPLWPTFSIEFLA